MPNIPVSMLTQICHAAIFTSLAAGHWKSTTVSRKWCMTTTFLTNLPGMSSFHLPLRSNALRCKEIKVREIGTIPKQRKIPWIESPIENYLKNPTISKLVIWRSQNHARNTSKPLSIGGSQLILQNRKKI